MIRVRELRESRGIQQKELAIDLGVSQPTVSDWESGRKVPSAKSTAKLADYFGVSVDYLLGRTDEKSAPSEEGALINNDPELTAYLEELSSRDELRMLFHVTKNATKEQIEAIVRMVESLNGKTDGKI